MKKYTLIVGQKSSSFDFETGRSLGDKFNGNFRQTNLFFDKISDAKKVAKMAGVDSFRVMKLGKYEDYHFSDSARFETPDIKAFFDKVKKDSEAFESMQERKVEEINSWPTRIEVEDLGIPNFKAFYVIGKCSYNKAYSRKIQMNNYFVFEMNRHVVGRSHFDPTNYVTRAGVYQVKKFVGDFHWEAGVRKEDLPEGFDYKNFLVKLRVVRNEFYKKVRGIK